MTNCDFCDKPATANYQKVWVRWRVYKNGGYSKRFRFMGMEMEEPIGDDNVHVCADHERPWLDGKI